jgi:hypothetical protein
MATGDAVKFLYVGAGTFPATGGFTLFGGRYAVVWSATLGGGNLQLQTLSADGSTFVAVGSAIAALGLTTFDLPAGVYRFVITTATANFISICRVPYLT